MSLPGLTESEGSGKHLEQQFDVIKIQHFLCLSFLDNSVYAHELFIVFVKRGRSVWGSRASSHFAQRRLRVGDVGAPVRSTCVSLEVGRGGLNKRMPTYTSSAVSE